MSFGNRVRFNSGWMNNPDYQEWLEPDPKTEYGASCKLCSKTFLLSRMGFSSLNSLAAGKKHKEKVTLLRKNRSNINACLKPSLSNDTTQLLEQNDANSVTENRRLQKAKKPTLTSYMTKDDVIESEILYVMISMDMFIRAWNDMKNQAVTKYLGSAFLQHCTALDLLREFQNITQNLNYQDAVEIGMGGPNVNFKLLAEFKKTFNDSEDGTYKIFDVGSCGIHTMHNSFKTGFEASGWGVADFLQAKYYLWGENASAAQKAQAEITSLRKYVQSVIGSTSKSKTADTKKSGNFQTIVDNLNDKLLRPKLAFS
ncbi:hypothetical protein QAD02_007339 [Eretmocerus hayati]|uniref:Uncharacterized protein n=1 Tax=Eretmocerus hayati TaxID=131215 RepID=A0ACC2N3R3_9HYME|nr:hypothetical protein QAD02_007339 [Eretmocerus hayati]